MNHYPWHGNSTLHALGAVVRQKTVKAECGKRVPYAAADPAKAVTCVLCAQRLSDESEQLSALLLTAHARETPKFSEGIRERRAYLESILSRSNGRKS